MTKNSRRPFGLNKNQRLIALALVSSTLGLIGLGMRAAQAQAWPCTAFEHANYGGQWRGLGAGGRTRMTGMNDKISSFRIARGCHVEVYEHRDFQGPSARLQGDVPFVGQNWNDLVSSWACVCN